MLLLYSFTSQITNMAPVKKKQGNAIHIIEHYFPYLHKKKLQINSGM